MTAVERGKSNTTLLACLQELQKRLQDRHGFRCAEAVAKKAAADAVSAGTVDPDAPNVLKAMMKLERANARAKTANKVALETEKEKDDAEKAVEELKRQLQPKRARTDDDAGDAHEQQGIWLPWSCQRSVGWPRSHGKIKGHARHHARQGAHIDRKNHLGNASGSALASHLLQQGLGHGARRHEDSAGCCDVSPR